MKGLEGMADKYIPEIIIGNTTYKIKDGNMWERVNSLESAFDALGLYVDSNGYVCQSLADEWVQGRG